MSEPAESAASQGLAHRAAGPIRYLWLVGVLVYLAIVWYIGWGKIRDALGLVDYRFITLFILLEAIVLWLRAFKWRVALGPGMNALPACFISKVGGNLTPGRVGELTPLLIPRHRSAKVGAWIVLDRMLEMATTLVLGLLGLLTLSLAEGKALIPWVIVFLAAMPIALFVLTREKTLGRMAQGAKDDSRLQRGLSILTSLSREMLRLGRKTPVLSALTLLAKCMDLALGWLLFRAFGFSIPFMALATGQCLHALVSAVPIAPNATGIPYLATAAFYYEIANIPPEILAVVIPVRVLCASLVFWPSVWLGIFVLGRNRNEANKE